MRPLNMDSNINNSNANDLEKKCRTDLLSRASDFHTRGDHAKAQAIFKQILISNPDDVDALFGFGLLALTLKQNDIALAVFTKTVDLCSSHFLAFFQRGRIQSQNKNYEKAISDFEAALAIEPEFFEAISNRGIAYSKLSKLDAALTDFSTAIKIRPESADAYYNRALAFTNLEKHDLAIADYTLAIVKNPTHFQAFNNRGIAYRELFLFDKAIADFQTCVELKPDFADGYFNKALTHLMIGDFANGWQLYEHRWNSSNFTSKKRNFKKPLWLGDQLLNGKTILLHSEQGLGDSLQFCRYIKQFKDKPCTVLLEVEKPLFNIMTTILPATQIFEKGSELPAFDFHCPLMSLPLAFKTTIDSVPESAGYLNVDREQTAVWQKFRQPSENLHVGLAWRGNPSHSKNASRSAELSDLINELSPEFEWYSLQIDLTEDEKRLIKGHENFHHFGASIGDFAKTGALCDVLDVIICVDTSIAHLAGALGVRTYLMLSKVPDARWLCEGQRTIWYDSVNLCRLETGQSYSDLIKTIQVDMLSKLKL